MDLGTAFACAALRHGGAEALVDGDRRRTYSEWYGEIRAVAGGLRGLGLNTGDHFVAVMRNRHEMATLYWASHMLGLIFTPVSWRSSTDEVAYCLQDAEAAAIAYDGAAGSGVPGAATACASNACATARQSTGRWASTTPRSASCFIRRAPPASPKACRARTAPSWRP